MHLSYLLYSKVSVSPSKEGNESLLSEEQEVERFVWLLSGAFLPPTDEPKSQSTLAMSLLSFVDPVAGSIRIDGLDISTIDLETLRQRISIIPQGQRSLSLYLPVRLPDELPTDAILFSGTIRQNIDPDDIYSVSPPSIL